LIVLYDPLTSKHRRSTRGNFLSGIGGGGGAVTGGENVGTGTGLVFKAVASGLLQFRKLIDAGGLTIGVDGDDVTLALADLGSELTVE
jgi:hypothetical protein